MRLFLVAVVFAASSAAAPAFADASQAKRFWEQLHRYETVALQDYRSRNMSDAVLTRSHNIWDLQTSAQLTAGFAACRAAAKDLSHMVQSAYFDASRGRVQAGWFHFADRYQRERERCLMAIGLDERLYPLPLWFGR